MRIISGYLKGKSIKYLKSKTTRPLKDLVKESIFNVINHSNLFNLKIEKAVVLDLYSGVGSFGLECISRGAKKVVFVEEDKSALNHLYKNITNLSVKGKVATVSDNTENYLKRNINSKFEIIFLDPPFLDNSFLNDLKLICEKKIFQKNHLVIIHREKKSNDDLENFVNPILTKNYGRSKIIFGKFLF